MTLNRAVIGGVLVNAVRGLKNWPYSKKVSVSIMLVNIPLQRDQIVYVRIDTIDVEIDFRSRCFENIDDIDTSSIALRICYANFDNLI